MERVEQAKGRVLTADYHVDSLSLLSSILEEGGYEVISARDSAGVYAAVQQRQPELILMNPRLYGQESGYAICARLKADPATRHLPVMFVSAMQDTQEIVRAFEAGAVDYITKPFRVLEVLARVENQLTLARQRQEIERLRERDRSYFETLQQMRQKFVQSATHDLRSPLNIIMGYTTMLERTLNGQQSDMSRQSIDGIRSGVERMRLLVTDILDLARVQSGIQMSLEAVDLVDFVARCIRGFEVIAAQKQIQFSFVPLQGEVNVMLDTRYFARVLDNLLSNAVKYTPEGRAIGVRMQLHGDEMVLLHVIDRGLGIPAKDLPHLFDSFYRVDNDDHLSQEGTGLGLSIVKTIVEQHNGEILVESELGRGSVFTVALPVARQEDVATRMAH